MNASSYNTNERENRHQHNEYNRIYKLLAVGDSGSGKTQLIFRFCHNQFSNFSSPTVLMEHSNKLLNDKRILAHFWDMSGREMFRSATTAHYQNAVGAVVVYDITKLRSLQNAEMWVTHLRKTLGSCCPVIMLVGNKLDLRHKRSVNADDGYKLAKKLGVLYEEVSAYDGTNVQKSFLRLLDHATNRIIQAEIGINSPFNSRKTINAQVISPSSSKSKTLNSVTEKDNKLNIIGRQPGKSAKIQHLFKSKPESCIQLFCCFS